MRREISRLWTWILLGTFVSFSICLPLGHDCLKQASAPAGHTKGIEFQPADARQIAEKLQGSDDSQRDDICQACVLAQSLLLDRKAVELDETGTAKSALVSLHTPIITLADHYQSASKRAPPISL